MIFDGALFIAVAMVVFVSPSPQPALVRQVEADSLPPFEDTRRLLASMFFASGLLLVLFGRAVHDPQTLRWVAWARLVTFAIVAAVNVAQLRGRHWKRGPLFGLLSAWAVLGTLYAVLASPVL
jgi:hypothetical protein